MKKVIKISAIIAGLSAGMISSLCAEDVILPYTFSAGETAKASEVNANFETLKNAVNSNFETLKNDINTINSKSSVAAKFDWVSVYGEDFKDTRVIVEDISFNAPSKGFVIVHATGSAYAKVGDRLAIAISDKEHDVFNWYNNPYHAKLVGTGAYQTYACQRFYGVDEGENTFYLVAENYQSVGGDGKASIGGIITLTYFPHNE
jgi:hypothetical protein